MWYLTLAEVKELNANAEALETENADLRAQVEAVAERLVRFEREVCT